MSLKVLLVFKQSVEEILIEQLKLLMGHLDEHSAAQVKVYWQLANLMKFAMVV